MKFFIKEEDDEHEEECYEGCNAENPHDVTMVSCCLLLSKLELFVLDVYLLLSIETS